MVGARKSGRTRAWPGESLSNGADQPMHVVGRSSSSRVSIVGFLKKAGASQVQPRRTLELTLSRAFCLPIAMPEGCPSCRNRNLGPAR